MARPDSKMSNEISAIWAEMTSVAGGDDPSSTLIPAVDPHLEMHQAPIEPPPTDTGRMRRTQTPMPVITPELAEATRHYHEFNRRYRLHQVIGEGGMGAVYLARQHALARDVAVKVLRRDDTQVMRRQLLFRAEALVTAYLEHPNIVPVYDAADHCLVMKHVRGETLETLIDTAMGHEDLVKMVEVLIKVCDAIRFAHDRGIIHRDIKAKNIMVGQYGEVLVLDWGLALSIAPGPDGDFHGPRLDRCPHVCAGTPGCLPPEIARGERDAVGAHSDLFMLGALLYHILTGGLPFRGYDSMESLQHAASDEYERLAQACPQAPRRLVEACELAMAYDPKARGTVAQFSDRLRHWLLTAGNEEIAETERKQAEELFAVGDRHAQQGDLATARSCWLEAEAHIDRAVRHLPDSTDIAALHHRIVDALARHQRKAPWWKLGRKAS